MSLKLKSNNHSLSFLLLRNQIIAWQPNYNASTFRKCMSGKHCIKEMSRNLREILESHFQSGDIPYQQLRENPFLYFRLLNLKLINSKVCLCCTYISVHTVRDENLSFEILIMLSMLAIVFKGELHPKSKLRMFCVLSQKYQPFFIFIFFCYKKII